MGEDAQIEKEDRKLRSHNRSVEENFKGNEELFNRIKKTAFHVAVERVTIVTHCRDIRKVCDRNVRDEVPDPRHRP